MKIKNKLTLLGTFLLLITIIPVKSDWQEEIEILVESDTSWQTDIKYWVAFSITENEIGDSGHRPYIMVSIEVDPNDRLYGYNTFMIYLYNGSQSEFLNDRAELINWWYIEKSDLIHTINIYDSENYVVAFEERHGDYYYWFDAFVAIDLWYWIWVEETTTTTSTTTIPTTTTSEKDTTTPTPTTTTTTTTEKSNGVTSFEIVLVPFSVLVLAFMNRRRKR